MVVAPSTVYSGCHHTPSWRKQQVQAAAPQRGLPRPPRPSPHGPSFQSVTHRCWNWRCSSPSSCACSEVIPPRGRSSGEGNAPTPDRGGAHPGPPHPARRTAAVPPGPSVRTTTGRHEHRWDSTAARSRASYGRNRAHPGHSQPGSHVSRTRLEQRPPAEPSAPSSVGSRGGRRSGGMGSHRSARCPPRARELPGQQHTAKTRRGARGRDGSPPGSAPSSTEGRSTRGIAIPAAAAACRSRSRTPGSRGRLKVWAYIPSGWQNRHDVHHVHRSRRPRPSTAHARCRGGWSATRYPARTAASQCGGHECWKWGPAPRASRHIGHSAAGSTPEPGAGCTAAPPPASAPATVPGSDAACV